jgi:type III restriction enzyme
MAPVSLARFQEEAAASGVDLFAAARRLLDAAGADASSRASAINHNGYLLIEAPTGSGKTLMAGTIVERFSRDENVVWFWFAPFKGVVGQTAAFLREQFHGLRLRDLSQDRSPDISKPGDVFVTTWQTVATRVKDKRNVRKDGEINPSIDTLIASLRTEGQRIGVVVDEAHHGFGEGTQAAKFFSEVLRPDYTILITATPDDDDVKAFEKAMGVAELQCIRIGRMEAVDAGLIKSGIKCAAYFVDPQHARLADLQATALGDGVRTHCRLKQTLAELKIQLKPLLLVQADSSERSVEKLKERLLALGFTAEQIATHTANEPDADLLALANDEQREVLIFKMAVALGFDAPRAFTLVSMRASRDTDFGVQLVGRILRVHRRLQARARAKTLPEDLKFGYVFLADPETQTGLDKAGQMINAIQTEYAKASLATVALRFNEGVTGVGSVNVAGQFSFFNAGADASAAAPGAARSELDEAASADFDLGLFFGGGATSGERAEGGASVTRGPAKIAGVVGGYRYPLRADAPRRFKTQVVSAQNEVTEDDCAQKFVVSARELLDAVKNKVPVEKRTIEVFSHAIQTQFNFAADLSPAYAAQAAMKVLTRNQAFDARELRGALLRKLSMTLREEAMIEADDPAKIAHYLNVILATHPQLLFDAQKAALASSAEILDADDLPAEVLWPEPLMRSARNIYGIMPAGLNSWEQPFAELLDRDSAGVVRWWHRNEPAKPWSVNVLMPHGRGFYPDFIIGIEGRKTPDNALLADPKLNFQREDEAPKVLAKHAAYGRVMILCRDSVRWMTVGYDEKARKPIMAREFRLSDAAGF